MLRRIFGPEEERDRRLKKLQGNFIICTHAVYSHPQIRDGVG
jgi:hypothetical protein